MHACMHTALPILSTSTWLDPDSQHPLEAGSAAPHCWPARELSWLCACDERHELTGWVAGRRDPSESLPCEAQ
eukprot:7378785-Prymnesium_polylepis.1